MGNNCLFYYKPDKYTKIVLEKENDNFIWSVYKNGGVLISKNKVDVDISIDEKIGKKYMDKLTLKQSLQDFLKKDDELKDKYIIDYVEKRIKECEKILEERNGIMCLDYYFTKNNEKIFYRQLTPRSIYIKYIIKLNNTEKIIYVKK